MKFFFLPFFRLLNISFSLQFQIPVTLVLNTVIFHFAEKKQAAFRLSTMVLSQWNFVQIGVVYCHALEPVV